MKALSSTGGRPACLTPTLALHAKYQHYRSKFLHMPNRVRHTSVQNPGPPRVNSQLRAVFTNSEREGLKQISLRHRL